MAKTLHLVDVNIVIARLFQDHIHNQIASEWLSTPRLHWAVCPWTEAGFLRYATQPGRHSMAHATELMDGLAALPGYHYHPVTHDWRTVTKPFFKRLQGHNQVTDAYLLGMAIHDGLIFATIDRHIEHVAGEYRDSLYIVGGR